MLQQLLRMYINYVSCMDLRLGTDFCETLHGDQDALHQVQDRAVMLNTCHRILQHLPALVIIPFIGAWSDQVGRKVPTILACLGSTLATFFYIISTIPEAPTLLLFAIGSTMRGIFCPSPLMKMAMHSYVSDGTYKEDRTSRMSTLLTMTMLGLLCGSLSAGVATEMFSFSSSFAIVMGIITLYAASTLLLMRDYPIEISGDKENTRGSFVSFIKDSFTFMFRKRDDKLRTYLLLSILAVQIEQACKAGEVDILIFCVALLDSSSSYIMYGYIIALNYASCIFVTFFVVPVLSKRFEVCDFHLVILGLTMHIIMAIALGLANQIWMIMCIYVVSSLRMISITGNKSIISKIVEKNETGKIFALLGTLEMLSNLLGSVTMTAVYRLSFKVYPGAAYIVDGGLLLLWLPVVCLLLRGVDNATCA